MIWKVQYYKNEYDWSKDILTTDEFDTFEKAADFTVMKIGNHMGKELL